MVKKKIFNWCKYSGGLIIFKLNPFQWNLIPKWQAVSHFGNDRVYSVCWLLIEARVWLDSGNW